MAGLGQCHGLTKQPNWFWCWNLACSLGGKIHPPTHYLKKKEAVAIESLSMRNETALHLLCWSSFLPNTVWVFPKIGEPQNGWFIMENIIRMDDLGVSLFSETSIYILRFHQRWKICRDREKRWLVVPPPDVSARGHRWDLDTSHQGRRRSLQQAIWMPNRLD